MTVVFSSRTPGLTDVAESRRAVERWVRAHEIDGSAGHALVLIASELVTNAVRTPTDRIDVALLAHAGSVAIGVYDTVNEVPVVRPPDLDATGGRGMSIVESLSGSWGAEPVERDGRRGKVVWAVLRGRGAGLGIRS
jgi:hypothetical protein